MVWPRSRSKNKSRLQNRSGRKWRNRAFEITVNICYTERNKDADGRSLILQVLFGLIFGRGEMVASYV